MVDNLISSLLLLPRGQKRGLVLLIDGPICGWSAWAAIYLRLGEWTWLKGGQWFAVGAAVVIGLPIFERLGLYRSIFRHIGWPAMLGIVRACFVFGFVYSLIFTFVGIDGVPRTLGLIQPVLLFVTLAASRVAAHYLLGGNLRRITPSRESTPRVVIYGAGQSGRQLAAALRRSEEMKLVGFIDDDRTLQTALVEGVRVHDPSQIAYLAADLAVSDVLLAIPSASRRRRREIVDMLRQSDVAIRTLPGLVDLARGQIQVSDIRPLDIEDLLGRDPVLPDPALLSKNVAGKTVMVTGGGGSIGSELSRQILDLKPARLVLVEAGEFALYDVHRELLLRQKAGHGERTQIVPLLASVVDENRMRAAMRCFQPHAIFHAAAYKHVPLVEHNSLEGLRNNALGTMTAARLAREAGVAEFVLISTDKAVRPTNVMGATKRLAELAVQALAEHPGETHFSIVRFGNVLGSSGSVVPLFREQISNGGPVTITHSDVTRYFMTIPEAAQLVLQAGAMASGGEVFVLDMGEPVLVRDLAVNMIQLSGLSVKDEHNPEGDIEIDVVGLRPGEKLHEELLIGENPMPTGHPRIMRAQEHFIPLRRLDAKLSAIRQAITDNDVTAGMVMLRELVPEYRNATPVADLLDPPARVELAVVRPASVDANSLARPATA